MVKLVNQPIKNSGCNHFQGYLFEVPAFSITFEGNPMLTPLRGQTSAKLAVRNPSSNGAPELAGEHFSPVFLFGGGMGGLTCLEKSNINMFCTYSSASGDSTCFYFFCLFGEGTCI